MRRALPLLLAAALLAACVAETVERRRPRLGPVKEVGYVELGGGHVRYSAEGWGPVISSRRRTAERLMRRNCGKTLEPRVIDEYERMDADAKYSEEEISSTLARGEEHFVLEKYVHLAYECRPHGWVEPAPSTAPARVPFVLVPLSTQTAAVPVSTAAAPSSPEPPR